KRLVEEQKPAGDLAPRLDSRVTPGDPEIDSEQLQDRQVRDGLAMRGAVRLVDGDSPCKGLDHELATEPALAYAGLAHDADHPPLALEGGVEGRCQSAGLRLASDEAREAAPLCGLQARHDIAGGL